MPRRVAQKGDWTGEKNPNWRGGRNANADGYIELYAPDHPSANPRTGRILEHRAVMEKVIGRFLKSDEEVHHLNGIKGDNRIENLEVLPRSTHRQITNAGQRLSADGFEWRIVWEPKMGWDTL